MLYRRVMTLCMQGYVNKKAIANSRLSRPINYTPSNRILKIHRYFHLTPLVHRWFQNQYEHLLPFYTDVKRSCEFVNPTLSSFYSLPPHRVLHFAYAFPFRITAISRASSHFLCSATANDFPGFL